jgi:hypothetical protein
MNKHVKSTPCNSTIENSPMEQVLIDGRCSCALITLIATVSNFLVRLSSRWQNKSEDFIRPGRCMATLYSPLGVRETLG